MIYLTDFGDFRKDKFTTIEELFEKLSVVEQNILDSIGAEIINIEAFFNSNLNDIELEDLHNNTNYNNVLKIKGLRKSNVEYTSDYETFLVSPFKFLLLYNKRNNNLQSPEFIIIQTFDDVKQDWNNMKMYKIGGNFKNFYEKLTNRTIEILDGDKKYLYQTTNKNEWELINTEPTDNFPKTVRKEELLKIINRYETT
jgi:hypothetical protein